MKIEVIREKGDHWWKHKKINGWTHSVCDWCGYDTGRVMYLTTEDTKNIPLCNGVTDDHI